MTIICVQLLSISINVFGVSHTARLCLDYEDSSLGKYADHSLSRQQGNDDTSPVESHPFFEDEDSAAWASFSSNVAIAYESLSNVPVRTFKDFFFHTSRSLGCETSSTGKEPLHHPCWFDEPSSCPEKESCS